LKDVATVPVAVLPTTEAVIVDAIGTTMRVFPLEHWNKTSLLQDASFAAMSADRVSPL
jgi:hypothetical protein